MNAPASSPAAGHIPRWVRPASIPWFAGLLGLVAIAVTLGFVGFERTEILERELRAGDMFARVLEDQTRRALNATDAVMASLAETLRTTDPSPARMAALMRQAQQGLPLLRSLSVAGADLRVIASSNPANVGSRLDARQLALPSDGEPAQLGGLQPGRDLADAGGPGAARHRHLPLTRRVATDGGTFFVVATLNVDHFANEFARTLDDAERAAALLDVHGRLLSATEAVPLAPGTLAADHPFFTSYLPRREHGHYLGTGLGGRSVVTAFRMLRDRPMAIVVELDQAPLRAEVASIAARAAATCVAALLVIGGLALLAGRSLRGYDAAQRALEHSRRRVARSERELRSLFESVHEVIFRTDAAGRITLVNARWQAVSGRSAASVIGRRLTDLCAPSEVARLQAWCGDAPVSGLRPAITIRLQTAADDLRIVEVHMSPEHEPDGRVRSYAGMMVDVTERHVARWRLEAELKFSSRLIEASPTPIFVKDTQGRFVLVNEAWLSLMGLDKRLVVGRRSSALFGGEAARHQAYDDRLDDATPRVQYDNRLHRPGREPIDTVVTKVRFEDAQGRPAGIIGSIVDVTQFREAERSIRRSRDAAEQANRAKSDFIANISHELRTPLQSIIGFSELGRDIAQGRDAELTEMFDDVLAGGRRMLALVNDLLDVARPDGSFARMKSAPEDLGAQARLVVREFAPLAADRRLAIEVRSPDGPTPVLADAFRLQQVIRNVLANALRFAPAGSAIDVAVLDESAEAVLEIRDRGPGIPPAEVETIFEPFVQSSRTQDGSGGTGLGLAICRKIMNAHRGTIRAGNADDGGARVRIALPRWRDTAPAVPPVRLGASPPAPSAQPLQEQHDEEHQRRDAGELQDAHRPAQPAPFAGQQVAGHQRHGDQRGDDHQESQADHACPRSG